jgi:hypothetical protein
MPSRRCKNTALSGECTWRLKEFYHAIPGEAAAMILCLDFVFFNHSSKLFLVALKPDSSEKRSQTLNSGYLN